MGTRQTLSKQTKTICTLHTGTTLLFGIPTEAKLLKSLCHLLFQEINTTNPKLALNLCCSLLDSLPSFSLDTATILESNVHSDQFYMSIWVHKSALTELLPFQMN